MLVKEQLEKKVNVIQEETCQIVHKKVIKTQQVIQGWIALTDQPFEIKLPVLRYDKFPPE